MKITVVGSGYVGTSNSVLLSVHNEVVVLDVSKEKVDMINNRISPIEDSDITEYLKKPEINLRATLDKKNAYKNAEYIIIAVPTDYNPETKYFNTSLIEHVIGDILKINDKAIIVIKSTIPVGYVKSLKLQFNTDNIFFSPEFLREGSALRDNLYPDRIIVGEKSKRAEVFAQLLVAGALKENIEVLYTDSTEAEAIKLFANTYLAMRVAFFNELDTYSEIKKLNSADIITGMSLDSRIGTHYNNPSFGYGGYCFPKDTKQLLANFDNIPSSLIGSIVSSNEIRKTFISDQIINKNVGIVGIFRLTMKAGSDNFRSSAIQDIIEKLIKNNVNVVIYEPTFKDTNYNGIPVINNINEFCEMSGVILANRIEDEIKHCSDKVYTRDIFNTDS
jgi:UDPglucose 6-dehydrogenase